MTDIASGTNSADRPGRRVTNEGRPSKGRRTAGRDSLFLTATIQRASEPDSFPDPVRVRNLSAVGLMADYSDIATEGELVTVTVRGIGTVAGKVAWLRRGRIGIAFDVEVDPIAARTPVSGAAPKHRPL